MQIAIDGPAASGKSTAAKAVAKSLNFLYVDTGAMYRAVTLEGIRKKANFDNEGEIVEIARKTGIKIVQDWSTDRGYSILSDGSDVTTDLFTPAVDGYVSIVARIPEVRRILVDQQRKLAMDNNVVMAGRDIGSNVLKNADLKIFLVADPAVRAGRRLKELQENGIRKDFEEILDNIKLRDKIDSGRPDDPLVKTPDAVEVDCSNMDIEKMVETIRAKAEERISKDKF